MSVALITGVASQDGGYLAETLLAAGDEVHGTVRPGTRAAEGVIEHPLDLLAEGAGAALVEQVRPDVIYNLAAISSIPRSWEQPIESARINGLLVAELLEAARRLPGTRFVQASSAWIFGNPVSSPQDESTPVRPVSPYGAAKAYAHHLVGVHRAAGMAASSCILFNHESPRRPEQFVTRKITAAAARIARGSDETLELGSLTIRRDWGWAPDYVDAMRRAAETPGDYVVATGVAHSIEEFVELAFARAGVEDWRGRVRVSDEFTRPDDAGELVGDASRAREVLAWAPTKSFEEVVAAMVDADLAA
jgi:GDPmannose 4,6-dehydratase